MVRRTERQHATHTLLDAYLLELISGGLGAPLEDSDDDDSDSDSDESDDPELDDLCTIYLEALFGLHSSRYYEERRNIPKTRTNLRMLLGVYKEQFPDIFRTYLRIQPACFDRLVSLLETDPAFHSESNNEQMPVEEQIAIALYRFEHYGNAASTKKVALWAGVGYGTVDLVTKRVMIAVCRPHFRKACVRLPTQEEKTAAQDWVENASCPAWRGGWCMVDGTLVPLFA